jgi:hypothetical protein
VVPFTDSGASGLEWNVTPSASFPGSEAFASELSHIIISIAGLWPVDNLSLDRLLSCHNHVSQLPKISICILLVQSLWGTLIHRPRVKGKITCQPRIIHDTKIKLSFIKAKQKGERSFHPETSTIRNDK